MELPQGFSDDPLGFLPDEVCPDEADGIWHVTTARDAVLADRLRSRRQLGGMVQGLGGGHNNQAPDKVSVTWSSGKAAEIESAVRLSAQAARDEVTASVIFGETAFRYRLDWFGTAVRTALRRLGLPEEIACDEWLDGLEEWLDASVSGGEAKYALLQEMDDAMQREFDSPETRTRVGLTAPFEAARATDPDQVCVLRVALRCGAAAEAVLEEDELRIDPDDITVLGLAEAAEEEPRRLAGMAA